MSLVCGSRMELGKACLDTVPVGAKGRSCWVSPGGVSTVARHAGGPARSSGEALVMRVERRGRVICDCVCPVNQGPVNGPGEELW